MAFDAKSISERLLKTTESKIQIYPCHNLRASNIGHPCERYLYLLIKSWQDQKPINATTQCIFDLGNKIEEYAISKLKEAGFEVITPVTRNWQIDDPYITGREDILIKNPEDGDLLPGEIKGLSPFEYDRLNTISDFLNSKKYYIRAYPMQLLTYMWKYNKEHGIFFIVNKLTGEMKPIDLFLKDHEKLMIQMLEKATRVNKAVADGNIPAPIDDADVCEKCPLAHICGHSVAVPVDVEFDDELDDLIDQRDSLKETKKTYEDLDNQIKEKIGQRTKVLGGKWLVTVNESLTVVPAKPETTRVTRRFKYTKLHD